MFRPNFFVIPYILIQDRRVQPLDAIVYGTIYWYHSLKDGVCFASNATMADIAKASPRGVQNSLTSLEKFGYIRRFQGPNGRQIIPLIIFPNIPNIRFEGDNVEVKCFYCGKTSKHGARFQKDHYIPKARGGTHAKSNLVLSCPECNAAKGIMTGDEYIAFLQQNGSRSPSPNDDSKIHQTVTLISPNGDKNYNSINNKELEKRGAHPERNIQYLSNIPSDDMKMFLSRILATEDDIKNKAEDLLLWCESNGRSKKNYRAFLLNALKRDFKKRDSVAGKYAHLS